jgi:type VI secretion system secreted protein VgrG
VEQTIGLATALLLLGGLLALLAGVRDLSRAPRQPFYLLRREAFQAGWRLIVVAAGFAGLAGIVRVFGAPTAFRYLVATPTITETPTITLSPTITLTPTITFTPSATSFPTITLTSGPTNTLPPTPTPFLPPSIAQSFSALVTPRPDATVSPVKVSACLVFNPSDIFINPLRCLYGLFSYDHMNVGVQWTALWYRNQVLVYYQSQVWRGAEQGNQYTDWNVAPDFFLPGSYEIQVFIGTEWKSSARFTVVGNPPTYTPTPTPSATPSPTVTPTPPLPRVPTLTPVPTDTRMPTATEITPPPTSTAKPITPIPTDTRWPTATTPS